MVARFGAERVMSVSESHDPVTQRRPGAGQRAVAGAQEGPRAVPGVHRRHAAGRLPGADHQRRHRGGDAGAGRERRPRGAALVDGRGLGEHRRRELPGAATTRSSGSWCATARPRSGRRPRVPGRRREEEPWTSWRTRSGAATRTAGGRRCWRRRRRGRGCSRSTPSTSSWRGRRGWPRSRRWRRSGSPGGARRSTRSTTAGRRGGIRWSAALAAAVAAGDLPRRLFEGMIDARVAELEGPAADVAAVEGYVDHTAGHLMELAARHLGAEGAALPVVRDFARGRRDGGAGRGAAGAPGARARSACRRAPTSRRWRATGWRRSPGRGRIAAGCRRRRRRRCSPAGRPRGCCGRRPRGDRRGRRRRWSRGRRWRFRALQRAVVMPAAIRPARGVRGPARARPARRRRRRATAPSPG